MPSVLPSVRPSFRDSVLPSFRHTFVSSLRATPWHQSTPNLACIFFGTSNSHFLILEHNQDPDPDADPQITLCFHHIFVSSIGDTPLHQSTPNLASIFFGMSKSHFMILEHHPDPDPDPQMTPKQDKLGHFTANQATQWQFTVSQVYLAPSKSNSVMCIKNPDVDPDYSEIAK